MPISREPLGLAAAMSIAGAALIASIAGLFLARSGTIHALFITMLIPASLALLAALVDWRASKPIATNAN
ncbi:hypothetical protein BLM14_29865 (plasmid) [Phyllobacterium zundukense]|nr:hypothetical protein BLM14_29865 [Phyllobacterium zundukense]